MVGSRGPRTRPASGADADRSLDSRSGLRALLSRITAVECASAVAAVVVLAVLVALEPDIVDAPFASTRAVLFTFGGTGLAAIALVAMLRWRVHPAARMLVLGAPFVAVNWWLISPFFIDDVVDDAFETSIAEQQTASDDPTPPDVSLESPGGAAPTPPDGAAPAPPAGPMLLGAGTFVGLAGHDGEGDAGIFVLADGSQVLRFENFDIQNGPDLQVYVVPGRDEYSLVDGSIHLGRLRGNVGDQTYELPEPGLSPGDWTVLVWCDAFSVEFVGASLTLG